MRHATLVLFNSSLYLLCCCGLNDKCFYPCFACWACICLIPDTKYIYYLLRPPRLLKLAFVRNTNIPTHFFLVQRRIGVIAWAGNPTNSRQFSHEIVRIAWNFWGLHGGALLGRGIPRAGHRAVSQTTLWEECVVFSGFPVPAQAGNSRRHFSTFADDKDNIGNHLKSTTVVVGKKLNH